MSTRDALAQSRLLTIGLLAGMAWLIFSISQVLGQFDYWNSAAVGQTAGTGVVGLLVLLAILTLSVFLFSGFGHDEPTAETWPPENADDST